MKNVLIASLLGVTLVAVPFRDAMAEVLPLRLEVDVSEVEPLDRVSAEDRKSLAARLYRDVAKIIDELRLRRQWVVTEGAADAVMTLRLLQRSATSNIRVELQIEGDESEWVSARFPLQVTPRQDNYADVLSNRVFNALLEKDAEIVSLSETIHSKTDNALKTQVNVDRPLSGNDRILYWETKFAIKWDRAARFVTRQSSDRRSFPLEMGIRPGETRSGVIHPKIYQAVRDVSKPKAQFCLRRPNIPDPDDGLIPKVDLACPLDGNCTLTETLPANWADMSCALPDSTDDTFWFPSLVRPAYAQTAPNNWSVPSLDTLYERTETAGQQLVGFTDFTIAANELSGVTADAFSVNITANGIPILIDGLAAEERLQRFSPSRGLLYRFGLENLNFVGREDGCERLSLEFEFYQDGEKTGDTLQLSRGYAALRNASDVSETTELGTLHWSGVYVQPAHTDETGIFLASRLYDPANLEDRSRVLTALNQLREAVDEQSWTIPAELMRGGLGLGSLTDSAETLRIVGKLRPPRTIREDGRVAYGVLVGVEEPSGQMQFTFDTPQSRAIARHLESLRASNREAGRLIPERLFPFKYTKDRQSGPDWVCNGG